ncbi:HAD hydrolase-like protein [Rhodoferax sp. GW822-FHT02A01]|uniref:HAD family hydrolase n=1 Tax=Rhodoferax sp. GW822-FHT02A01 TaxID=3141537 RepID=UPI00315D975D
MKAAFDAVVFDLDGTLIDSAPGILQGFELAFSRCAVTPRQPWTPALIGPPLLQTIAMQCASQDPVLLESLRQAFMTCYDTEGYRMSTAYDGIHAVLQALRGMACGCSSPPTSASCPPCASWSTWGGADSSKACLGWTPSRPARHPKAR